jgi:hypothetical protein
MWTKQDQEKALEQGWGIFNPDSRGILEIQKYDEADVFASDQEAILSVLVSSLSGDTLAIKAFNEIFIQQIQEEENETSRD